MSRVEDPEKSLERASGAIPPTTPLASQRETTAYDKADGLPRRPLDPLVVDRLAEFTRELERPNAPFGITGRVVAAVGLLAVAALLLVIMMPSLRQSGTASSFTADVAQFTAALARQPKPQSQPQPQPQSQPSSDGPARPAIADFKALLAEPAAQPDRDQPDGLLRQFMQWRQKTKPASNAQ